MRKAIYTKLIEIPALGNRVFQPYTAGENPTTPYAVIKMLGEDPTFENRLGSIWPFSIFLYVSPDSFVLLDTLVIAIKGKLDNVTLTTSNGEKFTPEYIKTLDDFWDDTRNLLMKRVDFDIGGARK